MQQIAAAKSVSVSQIINSPNRPLHKYSFWGFLCFWISDISAETSQPFARQHHCIQTNTCFRDKCTRTSTHKHQHVSTHTHGELQNDWHSHIHTAGAQGRSHTRTPSVNSHWLWCYYALSSQRGSAISPLMTMIHSVWSDNSIYTPANNREWKRERMIVAYVGATGSMPTQSGHIAHARAQILLEYDNWAYTLLCCPSVLCPLPALSMSRLQSFKQALGRYGRQSTADSRFLNQTISS